VNFDFVTAGRLLFANPAFLEWESVELGPEPVINHEETDHGLLPKDLFVQLY
jgi:hypothetical protein